MAHPELQRAQFPIDFRYAPDRNVDGTSLGHDFPPITGICPAPCRSQPPSEIPNRNVIDRTLIAFGFRQISGAAFIECMHVVKHLASLHQAADALLLTSKVDDNSL